MRMDIGVFITSFESLIVQLTEELMLEKSITEYRIDMLHSSLCYSS